MHLKTQNINTAFKELVSIVAGHPHVTVLYFKGRVRDPQEVQSIRPDIISELSRNGNVLRIAEPVTITYSRPTERVLFNTARDANPFSLLYEALWMLAGRNDVAPLAYYTKRFLEFSDDGKTLNGVYGYRWRSVATEAPHKHRSNGFKCRDLDYNAWDCKLDQLDLLVSHLKAQPNSRRAVLQMWNVEDDLLKIGGSLTTEAFLNAEYVRTEGSVATMRRKDFSKDVCCNLSVLFSLRKKEQTDEPEYYLDMTVTNRSNDLIWGTLGADYVTFTILQEYMAARLGAEVGVYNQFSNNMHVYDWNWKPQEWLAYYGSEGEVEYVPACNIVPLVKDPAQFEKELPVFVEHHSKNCLSEVRYIWREPFLEDVAGPMMTAYHFHKLGEYKDALIRCTKIEADDWRVAATSWIERRMKRKEKS